MPEVSFSIKCEQIDDDLSILKCASARFDWERGVMGGWEQRKLLCETLCVDMKPAPSRTSP